MPEPCPKASRVPSRRKQQRPSLALRPAPSRTAALFRLDDEAERRALDWIERFHAPGGIHQLIDIARTVAPVGPAHVIMLTRSQAQRPAARPEFLVMRYEPAVIRVSWKPYPSLDEARAAFIAATADNKPAAEVAHG